MTFYIKHFIVLLFLANIYGCLGDSIVFESERVSKCLSSSDDCNLGRSCSNILYDSDCLDVSISPTIQNISKVSCCFRCCISHFLELYKSPAPLSFDTSPYARHITSVEATANKLPLSATLLMSRDIMTHSAHSLINSETAGSFRSGGVHMMTSTGNAAYTSLSGRRMVLVNMEQGCVQAKALLQALKQTVTTPLIVERYFAVQLPCNVTLHESAEEHYDHHHQQQQSSTSGSSSKSNNPFKMQQERVFDASKLHFLPTGVRSAAAISAAISASVAKRTAGSKGEEKHSIGSEKQQKKMKKKMMMKENRPKLLDCSCALQFESGRDLVASSKQLQRACSYSYDTDKRSKKGKHGGNIDEGHTGVGVAPSAELHDNDTDPATLTTTTALYKLLLTTKYSLSPTTAENQSWCEFEAMALGVIPLVAHRQKYIRPDLYDGLPIHFFRESRVDNELSIKALTDQYWGLVKKFTHTEPSPSSPFQQQRQQQQQHNNKYHSSSSSNNNQLPNPGTPATKHYSLEKLYFPYWFSRMSQFLTTGKSAARPWDNIARDIAAVPTMACTTDREDNIDANKASSSSSSLGSLGSSSMHSNHVNIQQQLAQQQLQQAQFRIDQQQSQQQQQQQQLITSVNQRQLSISSSDHRNRHHNHTIHSDSTVEIVLSRCCEHGSHDFGWVEQLLSVPLLSDMLTFSVYYKCPHCLPRSMLQSWLREEEKLLQKQNLDDLKIETSTANARRGTSHSASNNISSSSSSNPYGLAAFQRRITVLDDRKLIQFRHTHSGASRVKQILLVDKYHNGKEVTPYLAHILNNYGGNGCGSARDSARHSGSRHNTAGTNSCAGFGSGALLHHSTLPAYSIFFHAVPQAHLHMELFYSLMRYLADCSPKPVVVGDRINNNNNNKIPGTAAGEAPALVNFLHLNVHYKMHHEWGSCCGCWGKPSSCRDATWTYLFPNSFTGVINNSNSNYSRSSNSYTASWLVPPPLGKTNSVFTYSSAQFLASRSAILRHPRGFWEKMNGAINGTVDLQGCCSSTVTTNATSFSSSSSTASGSTTKIIASAAAAATATDDHHSQRNNEWVRGHILCGQFERFWHIIFGQPAQQPRRSMDTTLPLPLRKDCSTSSTGIKCLGAV